MAYQAIPGQKRPTVVMVPGLHSYSHMHGNKVWSDRRGQPVRAAPLVLMSCWRSLTMDS